MKKSSSLGNKIKAQLSKLRKQPKVTKDQKLQCRIDTLNSRARDLHAQCEQLQERAGNFASRADATKAPEAPPAARDALFQRDDKAPPSQYDTQLRAYHILLSDWRMFEKDIAAFGKNLDHLADGIGSLKQHHFKPKSPMGKIEHEFESLDNAVFNLKARRVELGKAVSAVPLPAEKGV